MHSEIIGVIHTYHQTFSVGLKKAHLWLLWKKGNYNSRTFKCT